MVTWLATTLWMLNSAADKPLSVSYLFIPGTMSVTVGVDAKSEVLFSQVGVNGYCLLVSIYLFFSQLIVFCFMLELSRTHEVI
jgi:hypothetical protein